MADEPLQIKIEAYADSTLYNHTITVAVELTPYEYIPAWDKLVSLLTDISMVLGVETPKLNIGDEVAA